MAVKLAVSVLVALVLASAAAAAPLRTKTARLGAVFSAYPEMFRSWICTSLDQWFANARTHVER